MKTFALVNFLFLFIIILNSCEEKETENIAPFCTFIGPDNGQQIQQGTIVIISVEADDSDGNITKVHFYINGSEVGSSSSYPYNYVWNTSSENVGNHTLEVVAVDNAGGSITDKIEVSISGSVTDIEGNIYKTVKIGNQEWMAENLRTTKYSDGTAISLVANNSSWKNLNDNNAYCWYDNDISNKEKYGALYNWAAAMNGSTIEMAQGVCPSGWHLPSDSEWFELQNYLIANGYNYDGSTSGNSIAKSLATKTGWETSSETGHIGNRQQENNTSGFSALPGGDREIGVGIFNAQSRAGSWWSSSLYNISPRETGAWSRELYYCDSVLMKGGIGKYNGCSVRCLKD